MILNKRSGIIFEPQRGLDICQAVKQQMLELLTTTIDHHESTCLIRTCSCETHLPFTMSLLKF